MSCLVEAGSLSTTYDVDINPVLIKVLFSRVGMELLGAVLRVMVARFSEAGAQLLMGDETTRTVAPSPNSPKGSPRIRLGLRSSAGCEPAAHGASGSACQGSSTTMPRSWR
jgi:hypothetical protein